MRTGRPSRPPQRHPYFRVRPWLQTSCNSLAHACSPTLAQLSAMSSPPPADPMDTASDANEDDPMTGEQGEEGEGDEINPVSDDSSEEEEEDAEEEQRIRDGFIVDEEEEEEEEEEEDAEAERRRKRRKKHHRRQREREALEEDDLDLLEENTGGSFKKPRLTRLRRGRDDSPPTTSRRRNAIESSDDDIDNDDLELPPAQDIQRIFDDGQDDDDGDLDDMHDFIDYGDDEDGEGTGQMDEQEKEQRRRERRKAETARRRLLGQRPDLIGMDENAWNEILDIFGDGRDYDWALAGDDEIEPEEEVKPEMKYQDVFEPTEIRARHLTEDDDLIRAQDTPERMQLATSTLSRNFTLLLHQPLEESDLDDAAEWISPRISDTKYRDFFYESGSHSLYRSDLVDAVKETVRLMFLQELEAPCIWQHKRDLISYFDVQDIRKKVELLTLTDLWRIYVLGQKYRSLLERRRALQASYGRLAVSDDYFVLEIQPKIDSVEVVADATEWLTMKYKHKKRDGPEIRFHDDVEEPDAERKRKMPSRISAYEVVKKTIVSKLAEGFGIKTHDIVLNFIASRQVHFIDDQELNPATFAETFADPDPTKARSADDLLAQARMILATELGKDPLLRREIRAIFKEEALVTVIPTDKGTVKIDEHHPYFNFKYLLNKSVQNMLESAQFLHILAAESEHLVTVQIQLDLEAKAKFERRLTEAFASDSFSETAQAWNQQRALVVQEALEQHLLPTGSKWVREWLRDQVEDFQALRLGDILRDRIDCAPYAREDTQIGQIPSVLAVSWGKGNPKTDAITMVFVDEMGRLREHTKIDNLVDSDNISEFTELLNRRRPDVIVVAGFTMATARLSIQLKDVIDPSRKNKQPESMPNQDASFDIPVIYVADETARLYQHSKRAADEFTALSPIAKYCVGLARYAQSPLNEYAALSSDITAISLDVDVQHLVPQEKLLFAVERTLVDIVNKVGVDVNRAVTDSYYQHLLPFICGLGPRKAELLVKKIVAMGGNLLNRQQFVKDEILTMHIFYNAAGFLRISNDPESRLASKSRASDDTVQDPLDDTRIHPEDYELAQKMATDALELDEEDIQGEHPSHVVTLIMKDPDNERKLNELNLDDFAVNMYETNQERKRHTLKVIREELLRPFGEQRAAFSMLTATEVMTMLSGETPRTLHRGVIISVQVMRTSANYTSVRLDSGIEGVINSQYLSDADRREDVKRGQTIPGVVIDVKLDLNNDQFFVELSARPSDISAGDSVYRRVPKDEHWDQTRYEKAVDMQARKKRAEVDRKRRIIKHPNFHDFNSTQAEAFLEKLPRGEVVIRPSSKGPDHLAVTWKVEDRLYQHIDVYEPNADPTGQTVGGQLIVDEKHRYSDLDELIVTHVQACARRVEDLMNHERFKPGHSDDLHLFLKNYVAAHPAKSMYGFTLNRNKPGHFLLCFLANKNSTVQTWPVRVAPEAYYLFDAPAVGVPELCDAFKVRHLHESKNLGAGGKTPYVGGGRTPAHGGRTPARTPGHVTPGHMSVRPPARTPNPYAGGITPRPYGGMPPPPPSGYGMPPPVSTPYGYQTPSGFTPRHQPPGDIPPGMPSRSAMIPGGGWGPNAGASSWS